MIRILDPTLAAAPAPPTMPRAPRPAVLRGATLGLLANGKSNGMALLDRIAEHLCERHGVAWHALRSSSVAAFAAWMVPMRSDGAPPASRFCLRHG